MEKAMLNCGLNVCENDTMSMFEGCPNNELLELLKTKKHARMFGHMLKYFENENHILHNSLCESNSLIKKYKRRNRILCDKIENRVVHGSGLCSTQNRPAGIRWRKKAPVANPQD